MLAIDIGTSEITILRDGEVVLREPSVIAVDVENRKKITLGAEAKKMMGRSPEYIEVLEPIRSGVIVDYEAAKLMLKGYLQQVMGNNWFIGPEVVTAVPSGNTQVEQRAVMDATLSAGAKRAYLIDEPLAAAIGAKIPVAEAAGNMIVDIGGGAAEAAVIALGGVVTHKGVRMGGNKLDVSIREFLRKRHNLIIVEQTAENIKITIGSATKLKRPEMMQVNGRDSIFGLPKAIELSSDDVYEALKETLTAILTMIRETLEVTPPELVADIADRGIVLSGGTSQLRNFNKLVTSEIGVAAHIAPEPQFCVIKGVGAAIENLEVYRRAIR